MDVPEERFPRAHRILRRAEFLRLYDQGAKVHGRLMTLFALPSSRQHSRLGVAATRKMGGAVVRNRARRRVRELFRRSRADHPMDLVVVARRELATATWDEVEREFHKLIARQRRALGRASRG